MVGRLVEAPLEHEPGLLGKRGEVPEESQANVLLVKERKLVHQRRGKEVHEKIDLALRAPPVLRGERVDGEGVKAKAHAGRNRLAQRVDARDVALGPVEAARGGPSAVSVHDDRDMRGHPLEVNVLEADVLRGVRIVRPELF